MFHVSLCSFLSLFLVASYFVAISTVYREKQWALGWNPAKSVSSCFICSCRWVWSPSQKTDIQPTRNVMDQSQESHQSRFKRSHATCFFCWLVVSLQYYPAQHIGCKYLQCWSYMNQYSVTTLTVSASNVFRNTFKLLFSFNRIELFNRQQPWLLSTTVVGHILLLWLIVGLSSMVVGLSIYVVYPMWSRSPLEVEN